MRYQVDGVNIAYDDEGAGVPLVLLHGFPFNRTMWRPQIERFSGSMRLIAPDLRGHGESDAPDHPYGMDLLARDVMGLLDALGLQTVVLGGLSMGGYVAFAFYRAYRERVRGLLLFDTRAEADTEEGRANRMKMVELARSEGVGSITEQLLPKVLGETTQRTNPDVIETVRRMMEGTKVAGIANALVGMAQRPDMTALLPLIACPTFVVAGEEDAITPPAVGERLASAIPNAEFAMVPLAGHLSNLEQPKEFNRALAGFLEAQRLLET